MVIRKKSKKFISNISILFIIMITGVIQAQLTSAATAIPSSPRYGHEMVYDEHNNQVVLFGGSDQIDTRSCLEKTWLYSSQLKTWTSISSSTSPTKRIGHKMVYNSISGKIILFGGMETADYTRTNDLWSFDPETLEWSELTPLQSPSARSDYGMYFDSISNAIVLFGGYLANDLHSSETWIYNFTNNNWNQIFPLTEPAARYGHNFIYDSNLGVGVLFGGRVSDLMADTWFFNLSSSTWTLKATSNTPIKRYWCDMVYSPHEEKIIMFGGDNEQSSIRALGDTWTLNTSSLEWTSITPIESPPPRNNLAMVYDSYLNKTLLFGGLGEDYSKVYGDFWMYDSEAMNWSLISISSNNTWWIILVSLGGVILITGIVVIVLFIRKKRIS